jgi:hypothetical protein
MSRARMWTCLAAAALGSVAAVASLRGGAVERAVEPAGAAAGPAAPDDGARVAPVAAPAALAAARTDIGSEAFATLPLTAAEQRALRDLEALDPSGLGRVLGEFLLGGYHHESLEGAMNASMTVFADERLARLSRNPDQALALVRGALRLPSLAGPDLAYARISLLAAAGRLPGKREATHELARAELTAPALPTLPPPPNTRGADEAHPPSMEEPAASSLHTALVYALAVFVDTAASPSERLDGTTAAIRAQSDPSLRLRLAQQLLSTNPEAQGPLASSLAASGIKLELPL